MCLIWMLLVVARKPKICLMISFSRTSDAVLVSSGSVNINLDLGISCIFVFCGTLGHFICNICELSMESEPAPV